MVCYRPRIGQSGQNRPRGYTLGRRVSVLTNLTKYGHNPSEHELPLEARASEESEHAIKTSATARDSAPASKSEPYKIAG